MPIWDEYPADYREDEVRAVLSATRAGDCVSIIGLSGAGKSNLMGFLYHRCNSAELPLLLLDGNRSRLMAPGVSGLFRLITLGLDAPAETGEDLPALEHAISARLSQPSSRLCLLFDRYDALTVEERAAASGPLRALRDAFKYQLTYVIAMRRPLDPQDELAELFYANTIWLGPLSHANARWSAAQYAARRSQVWEAAVYDQLIALSGGYPALLRACCEAYAAGAPLKLEALRAHPAVQRRVQEFWADLPALEDLRRSGLIDASGNPHPLLSAAQPAVSVDSPDLTASEHRLLRYFQSHPGELCTKDDLIRAVWPEDRVLNGLRDDALAQLIRRLRQKIGAERIQTLPGRGYRYQPEG